MAIIEGDMGLSPMVGSRRPLFTIDANARPLCDPSRVPLEGADPLADFGEWSLHGTEVEFRSERGFGRYRIRAETVDAPPPGNVLFRLDRGGRKYVFKRARLYGARR
ncbi:MAG: hypothetical protein WKF55_01670 [Gemmatimonadaceae bacterium]